MQRIRAAVARGALDQAAEWLRERVAARQDERGGHPEEARLAERLGLSTLAVRAWQLAVRDDPTDLEAWTALALLHEERGDPERARACSQRVEALSGVPADTGSPAPNPEPPPPGPSDSDLVRLSHRFAGREGVHARMWHDRGRGTGYAPVREPLTPAVWRAHLEGTLTAGVYLVRHDQTTGFAVVDLDATRPALEAVRGDAPTTRALQAEIAAEGLRLRDALRAAGLDPLLVDSGYKGRHLWCFFPRPVAASEVRATFGDLLDRVGPTSPRLSVELFPKQDTVPPGGLGNLVKLPMGIHLRTGRRCAVLDEQGAPAALPIDAALGVRAVPLDALRPAAAPAPDAPPPEPTAPPVPLAPAPEPWSEVDFERSEEVAPILRRCSVLRGLVDQVLAERTLSRDGAIVLAHSLGHLSDGVTACNYLYDLVPGFPAEERMGKRHRGSPVSCARIRRRLPRLCDRVGCDCVFPEEPGQYPNPLRHLDDPLPDRRPPPGLEDLLARYVRQRDRLARLEEETDGMRRRLVAALDRVPGRRWAVEGGTWSVEDEQGLPVLRFHPTDG